MSHSNNDAIEYLRALVKALETSFISNWQSTHGWQNELDSARDYLNSLEKDEQNDF